MMHTEEWYDGYSAFERGSHWNPFMGCYDDRLYNDWQEGYEAAKQDHYAAQAF